MSMPYAVLAAEASNSSPIDYERALALSDKALAPDPKNATAHLWRTGACIDLGYFDRAEQGARQSTTSCSTTGSTPS